MFDALKTLRIHHCCPCLTLASLRSKPNTTEGRVHLDCTSTLVHLFSLCLTTNLEVSLSSFEFVWFWCYSFLGYVFPIPMVLVVFEGSWVAASMAVAMGKGTCFHFTSSSESCEVIVVTAVSGSGPRSAGAAIWNSSSNLNNIKSDPTLKSPHSNSVLQNGYLHLCESSSPKLCTHCFWTHANRTISQR